MKEWGILVIRLLGRPKENSDSRSLMSHIQIGLHDNSPLRNFTYLDYLLFSISIRVWQDSFKLCILRSQFDKNDNNNLLRRFINTNCNLVQDK